MVLKIIVIKRRRKGLEVIIIIKGMREFRTQDA